MEIQIDPTFRDLLQPLSADERQQLEQSILDEGCHDPLLAWNGTNPPTLLDGHNRHEICTRTGRGFKVDVIELGSWEEARNRVIKAQLARRNITPEQASYLRGLRYNIEKSTHGGSRKPSGQNVHLKRTCEELAAEYKTNEKTIRRDGKFAENLHHIEEAVGPVLKPMVLQREKKLRRNDVNTLAKQDPEYQSKVVNLLLAGEANNYREARQALRVKEESRDRSVIEEPRILKSLEDGIERGLSFRVIYADPPWQYGNQGTRAATNDHYSTMTVEQITALPVEKLAAEQSHLFMWTTAAFLPDSFEIIRKWGFDYKTYVVWHKPQMGIGNYFRKRTELLLFASRGSLDFPKAIETDIFTHDRIGHSVKPELFRRLIESVNKGPYLEMFARRLANNWYVWGNQIEIDMFYNESTEQGNEQCSDGDGRSSSGENSELFGVPVGTVR